jgi:hypothetical protein
MESEGLLQHSKVPATFSFLSRFNPVHTPTSHFLKIHLNIIPQSTPGSPQWSLSLRFSLPKPCTRLSPRHPHYMPRPFHSRFYHRHSSGWGVQIIKLLIMKFSPLPCYLIPRRPKYSQHPTLKHPQPPFLPQCQRPSFTSIQNRQGYIHTLRMRNAHCPSTVMVVARTRLRATLYMRCLSHCICTLRMDVTSVLWWYWFWRSALLV